MSEQPSQTPEELQKEQHTLGIIKNEVGSNLDVDKFTTPEGNALLDRYITAARISDEEMAVIELETRELGDEYFVDDEVILRCNRAARDFYAGKIDFPQLIAQLERTDQNGNPDPDYRGHLELAFGLLKRGGGGAGGGGTSEAERMAQLQAMLHERAGAAVGPGGESPWGMRTSSEYAEMEQKEEEPRVADDPHGRFMRLLVVVSNGEGSAYPAILRLRAMLEDPRYYSDMERAGVRIIPELGNAYKAQKGPDLDHLAASVGELRNDIINAVRDLGLPVVVQRGSWVERIVDGKTKREWVAKEQNLRTLNILEAAQILDADPDLRSRYFSDNKDVKWKAELEWADRISQKMLGVDIDAYKQNDQLYRFYTLKYPPGKSKASEIVEADVTKDRLIPFAPFKDVPPNPAAGKMVYEQDYRKGLGIKSQDELQAAHKWLEVAGELFLTTWGSESRYDPAILGFWPYPVRPTLRPETYRDLMYSMGIHESRPFARSYYESILGENIFTLVPAMGETRDRKSMEMGLEGLNAEQLGEILGYDKERVKNLAKTSGIDRNPDKLVGELKSRIVDLRSRVIQFMFGDYALRPWLEVYLSAMAKGERVEIPEDVFLLGFEERNERYGVDMYGKNNESTIVAKPTEVNFGSYADTLQFLLFNKSQKADLRTTDQIRQAANGLVQHRNDKFMGTSLAKLFKGWSAVSVLKNMGVYDKMSHSEKGVISGKLKPGYMSEVEWERTPEDKRKEAAGLNGLWMIAQKHSLSTLNWSTLRDYDLWKWMNYLSNARKSADGHWNVLQSTNLAGIPWKEVFMFTEPYHAMEELGNLSKAVSGEMQGSWAYLTGNQKAEILQDTIVALFSLGVAHEQNKGIKKPRRRFLVEHEPSANNMDTTGSSVMSEGSQWDHIKVPATNIRKDLGFYYYQIQTNTEGTKPRGALIGPGGSVVFEAADTFEDQSPCAQMFGGREFDVVTVVNAVNAAVDAGFGTEEPTYDLMKFLLYAYKGRISELPVLSKTEMDKRQVQAIQAISGQK